ncbi:MAG: S8 family serine peptidase [Planctomycetaceae bacterium]|nr:S8 family serine peptidase [Planctomycetaceae bacterium]
MRRLAQRERSLAAVRLESLEPRILLTFEPLSPLGSLIYQDVHSSEFSTVPETDSFTLDVDAQQTLSGVVRPDADDTRFRIEVFDPEGISIGVFEAEEPGQPAFFQTLAVVDAGVYQVEVTNLEGAGAYALQLFLNTAVEEELLTGYSNDTLATAEDVEPTFLPLVDTGARGAVVGDLPSEAADVDWYAFSLSADELVTVVVAGQTEGSFALDLYDASGACLATGVAGGIHSSVDQRITGYAATADGTYYAAVHGEGQYALVVTRGMTLDIEPNTRETDAQPLAPFPGVVGNVGRDKDQGGGDEGTIRVALLKNSSMSAHQQLADDTYFDFEPVLVTADQIDTVEELDTYDVVVIGDPSANDDMATVAPALRTWVEAGGGVVGVGWLLYASGYDSGYLEDIDAVIPVRTDTYYKCFHDAEITITDPSHPVTAGLSSFALTEAYIEYSGVGPDPDGTVLGTTYDEATVVVGRPGLGRGVYLGPVYANADNYPELMTGPADQLFEQAVAWAARGGLDAADQYWIEANPGDNLVITTTTPGDGACDPGNALDPLLELYDADGTLVASNNNWPIEEGGDGRNARIVHTVLEEAGGTYRVRVSPVLGSGDYTLQIAGATGLEESPLAVTAASIVDGAALAVWPDIIQLDFSASLLLTSLQAEDLTVNGLPAASVMVVDGNTLVFDLAGTHTGDGPYMLELAAGALQDVAGVDNAAFELGFTLDTTSPVVMASSIAAGATIEPGALTYTVTLSEELATAGLGPEDVELVEQSFGVAFIPSSFAYDAESGTLTVHFEGLYDGRYKLTLWSGPEALRDLLGNALNGSPSDPLPSGQGDPAPDAFVLEFFADAAEALAYPVPLEPKAPLGSLIFDPSVRGTIHESNGVDVYTIDIDAGHTVTVVLDARGGLQGSIELQGPDGTTVASVSAATADEELVLQTAEAIDSGTYRLMIGGVASTTGRYTAQVIVNAAVEWEQHGGASNDELADAQDLSESLIDLGDGLQRAAVLGTIETFASAPVSLVSGCAYGAALSSLVDETFRPRGTVWHDGTVYWYESDTEFEISLATVQSIIGAKVQADNNDEYQLDWYDYGDDTWKPLWTVPNYADRDIAGIITRPDYPLTDVTEFYVFSEPVATDRLRFRAITGDDVYSASEIQLLTGGDWYSLALTQGEAVSTVLAASGNVALELLNDAGIPQAIGLSGRANVTQAISDFVVPSTGTYYWRVMGHADYSLTVTRNAAFELEPNDLPASAQPIGTTGAVVGHLWQTVSDGFENLSFPTLGWSVYSSSGPGRVRATELYGGASGYSALVMDSVSGSVLNEAVWTVDLSGATTATLSFAHCSFGSEQNHSVTSSYTNHCYADGVSFSCDGTNWYRLWTPELSETWQTVDVDLVAQAAARGVSLNDHVQIKFQQYDQYAAPTGGRAWDDITIVTDAGEDQYLVDVAEGDSLTIITTTPGNGPSEPANTLVPRVELFDQAGALVGSNDQGAPDGHNALLSYSATTAGTYRIRVTALSGEGTYTLRVTGATGEQAFHVVNFDPADSTAWATFPATYRVGLSEGVLLTSLDASDLQITRPDSTVVNASSVALIDANSLLFTIAEAADEDGEYLVTMAADSLTAVSGSSLGAFSATFSFDTTGPIVLDTSIPDGGTVNSGSLTWTVVFNEDLATSDLGPEDVTLADANSSRHPDSLTYDAATDTLSVTFAAVAEGTYTLTLESSAAAFRDVLGNLLDGNADGITGDPFSIGFTVDTTVRPLAAPLRAVQPSGALIHDSLDAGLFATVSDRDTYTVVLDAGQTATVVLRPLDASIRARVELTAPDNVVLGVAEATAAGHTVILQTVPVVQSGTYSLAVLSLAGSGPYEVQFVLNARLESETHGGGANDSLNTAEDLADSAIVLSVADRLAVVGQTDSGEAGIPDYFTFHLAEGQFATVALTTAVDTDLQLQLRDATDTLLVVGQPGALNVGRSITTYRAPVAGQYYALVSGAADTPYTLLVTRGADFDLEPNDDKAPAAQDITATGVVLGALCGELITTETEPNGSVATANDWSASFFNIGPNQFRATVTGMISEGSDSDWDYFKIRVSQGDTLQLDLEGSPTGKGTLSDTYLRLFNSAGDQLASDDDAGMGFNSRLYWNSFPWATGDYYVVADSWGSRTGTYTLTANLTTSNLLMSAGRDYYSVSVNAGDVLTLRTFTPAGDVGEFVNDVDPVITLYDPSGTEAATDDNSADGRNALLTYTATATGAHTVKVAAATYVPGEYVLVMSGHTGALPSFTVFSTEPVSGELLNAYPATYRVVFSEAILLTSLSADDLTVDGVPADSVTIVDGDTVEFNIASANTGDGLYTVAIAAGAITGISGQSVQSFSATFDYDATAPWVIASSVGEHDTVAPGTLIYQVQFSEELAATELGVEDVTLVESMSGAAIVADELAYDAATSTATVTFSNLAEGNYTLTLLTSATAFRDRRGNLLDGTPSFPLPSGDDTPGDPFVVPFQVDSTTEPIPTPLLAVVPAGSLIHSGSLAVVLNTEGDVDAMSINLDAGQNASIVVAPQVDSVRAKLEFFAPDDTSLGVVSATAAGQTIYLQTLPVAMGGTYRIEVTSITGYGPVDVQLTLNAALEVETLGGAGNDSVAAAQDLATAWTEVGNGSQRAAVLGTADGAAGTPDVYGLDLAANECVTWMLTGLDASQPALEVLDSEGNVLALGAGGAASAGQSVVDFVVPDDGRYYTRVTGSGDYSLLIVRDTEFEIAVYSYFADFQDSVGSEWSTNTTDSSSSSFTTFLGRFNNGAATLTLPTLPGQAYLMEFDLMIIDSWDGNNAPGPDYFNIDVDGIQQFHHTFTNSGVNQTYPGAPDVSGRNFGWGHWHDAIYRCVSVPFIATSASTAIRFYDSGLQGLSDESWGIDNVRVREQDLGLTGRVLGYYDGQVDQYQFVAEAGNVLSIYTTTPGGDAGEPANAFDPYLQLYGPAGLLVAVDDNSGPQGDDRNAGIAYTVPAEGGGAFTIRVLGTGSGAYTLNVEGASGAISPLPKVLSTVPTDGQPLAGPPASLDLTFSQWLRVDTLDAGDLTLDQDASVTGLQVIDGRTVRYLLNVPDVEATYTYTLAAGSVLDLQGDSNPAYQGTFRIDKTGPHVTSQIPALQTSAPFSQLTFVFDEAIDPISFTTSDVVQFTGPGGVSLMANLTGVLVAGNQATVQFEDQSAQGTYIMRIGPNIQDMVGNKMDQNGNGTPGEAGDYYLATVELQSADLTVADVDLPDTAVFGAPITFSWTVRNIGSDPAREGWKDQAWLSTDATHSADDIPLLAAPLAPPEGTVPLGVNGSYTQTVTVNLPLTAALSDGIYYVVVKGDASGQQAENDESNNYKSESLSISLPPLPDLVVSDIDAPIEGLSGQNIQYSWTVTNQGSGPATGTWHDRVLLSTDVNLGSDLHLGDFSFTGTIAAGESITRTQTYTLPIAMEGDRWFIVQTDVSKQLFEHANDTNNTLVDDVPMHVQLSPFPNLQVTEVIPPAEAFSSQQAVVEWVVTNNGTGSTSAPVWYDAVWLSTDSVHDGSDTYMGAVANPSYLNPGDSYVSSLTVTLPQGIQGDYWFIIQTDSSNHVYEHNRENDNIGVEEETHVTLTPPPDLQVEDVTAPDQVFTNQTVTVSWTVVNDETTPGAGGRTLQTGWYDTVYLSDSPNGLVNAINMGSVWHSGALDAGESYDRSMNVAIPVNIEGPWYFYVATDSGNHVFEHIFESNNLEVRRDESEQPRVTNVTMTPPDLEVDYVAAPTDALSSHPLTITYQVTNYGVAATPNSWWTDACYLSVDETLDTGDLHLGDLTHYGGLDIEGTYTRTATFTLPDGLAGDFYVLVKTDVSNVVFEGVTDSAGETNNVASSEAAVHVVSNPPDLVIMPGSFEPWATGQAGSFLRATWGVLNQGTGATVGGTWKCRVYASLDNVKGGGDDRLLATFVRSGDLAAGAHYYAIDKQIDLPIDFTGIVYLYVRTDADGQVYEGANEDNNDSALLPVTIVQNLADLQVSEIGDVGGSHAAGDWIPITWVVQNFGTGATNALSWRDRIYLSPDDVLGNGNDIQLGSKLRSSPLGAGEAYTGELTVQIPASVYGAGPYYLGVRTDADGQVFEGTWEDNNTRLIRIGSIEAPPPGTVLVPDLVLVDVDAPAEAYSGQAFSLSWTVRNDGDPTPRNWYDQVYLSLDQVYDSGGDISLGHVFHDSLVTGASYTETRSFSIPRGLSGPFYVFVVTDRGNHLAESNELNNTNYDRTSMLVQLVPPADLVVGTITIPANASPGFNATIAYTVENQGDDAALGSWYDSIYISADGVWDINDAFFGRVEHVGSVAGHSSYSEALTAPLPGVIPGDYHVIIRSDIRNHIPESDETNNIGASLDQVEIDAQLLELGSPQTGNLAQGRAVYYKTEVLTAGETVRLSFSGAEDAYSELYVRCGSMPSRNQHDWAANQPFVSNQQIILPVEATGVYYVMAYATVATGAPEYAITADVIPFSIQSVDTSTAGNSGNATVKVSGARFTSDSAFYLLDGASNALPAERVYLQDSATAFVTFDLFQVPPGVYTVAAYDPIQHATARLEDALTVVVGEGYNIDALGQGPTTVLAARNYRFDVFFGNDGDGDTMAPLLLLTSSTNTRLGFSASAMSSGAPLQILGTPDEGPLNILRPGALNSVSVYYNSGGAVNVRIEPIAHDDVNVITSAEWEQIKASVKPASVSLDDWNAFWANIPSRIGATWGHYVRFLNRLATELSEPGKPIRDVREMFETLYQDNPGFQASSLMSGTLLDSHTGEGLADVAMAAYRLVDDRLEVAAETTTGADGSYQFAYLAPGQYAIALASGDWDMDRDGDIDDGGPVYEITDTSDLTGVMLYAIPFSDTTPATIDTDAAMACDAEGVTHIVWNRDGAIWYAYFNGTEWTGAKPITETPGDNIRLHYADNLLNGSGPGLIAVWEAGGNNDAEIHYALGMPNPDGEGYIWTKPFDLTDDALVDANASVAIGADGTPIVVYQKTDNDIVDDHDLYYQQVDNDVSAVEFYNLILIDTSGYADNINVSDISTEGSGDTFTVTYNKVLFDKKIIGIRVKLQTAFGGTAALAGCDFKLGVLGQASLNFDSQNLRATLTGRGTLNAKWKPHPVECQWTFDKATATVQVTGDFEFKNALTNVLKAIPHPVPKVAAKTIEGFKWVATKMGAKPEDGIYFQIATKFNKLEWNFQPPFPDFILPDRVDNTLLRFSLGPYLRASWGDNYYGKVTGYGAVETQIWPSTKLKELTLNLRLDGKLRETQIRKEWSVGYYASADPLSVLEPQDAGPWIEYTLPNGGVIDFRYNPDVAYGSSRVYGTNSVLADVGTDLFEDGAPSVVTGPDGKVYVAWSKELSPEADSDSEILVSSFTEGGWSPPESIPGVDGLVSTVQMVILPDGRRVVVWSQCDLHGLTRESTPDEVFAMADERDLFYSVYDAGWSTPLPLAANLGYEGEVDLMIVGGDSVMATWLHKPDGFSVHSMVSVWDGSTWSEPESIAQSDQGISSPQLQRLGTGIVVFWNQDVDPDPDVTTTRLMYSTCDLETFTWSTPTLFVPLITLAMNLDATGNQDPGSSPQVIPLGIGLPFGPPDVPEDCCKCKKFDTVYCGNNEGCGFTESYDEKNCKKIITYKPCIVYPLDPNDITGPAGYGDEHWVEADRKLDYMIRYENDPEFATAPAQKVTITQLLDPDLDYRTFRLRDFGFGGLVFDVPDNRAFYSTRIDLTEDRGYFVDVTAGIDIQTGQAFWTFVTIDPETGEQPLAADVGFLAINDENGSGEGYVTYSVRAKRTAETGDRIDALARIVFDTNEPMDTPPIFNTLDAGDPQSHVMPLPETAEAASFLVSWTGSDAEGGSGLAAFTVFVSDNDGPFVPWMVGTHLIEAEFLGREGHRYAFYSVAFDNAGNQEGVPTAPDAVTVTPGGVATLGDLVWSDSDGDGLYDDGELGLPGVTVRLYLAGATEPLAETTTDGDGLYSFPELDIAQSYFLEFVAPAGYGFSPRDAGSDDTLDSDVALDTGRTEVFTVISGANSQWDAGLLELCTVSGVVWWDRDGDGQQEDGEPLLANQVVYLDKNRDGDKDDDELAQTTDANGWYQFEQLRPGQHVVRYVLQDGWEQTYPGSGGASSLTYTGSDVALYVPGDLSGRGVSPDQLPARLDVNSDGYLSPVDALLVINALNAGMSHGDPSEWPSLSDPRDVNGDGLVTPADALVVINRLNTFGSVPLQPSSDSDWPAGDRNPALALIGLDDLRVDARFANLDGSGLAVVVIDTGIDLDHSFFGPDADGDGVADRIVFQYDFADRDACASDYSSHGSHVTSIIASQDEDYPGIAPNVDVIHLKVFSDNGRGSFSYLEQALQWVVEHTEAYHIAAVNLSLGDGQNWSDPVGLYGISDELAALDALGVITVSAAGNSYAVHGGREGLAYPAADPHTLAVGAVWDSDRGRQSFGSFGTDYTTAADRIAGFSQRDAYELDALAPGALIAAANATGGVATMRGTSMATPYVTGAAVLAQQLALERFGQRLSASQFRELLRSSGAAIVDGDDEDDSVPNTGQTYFRLDLPALASAVWDFDPTADHGGNPGGGDGGDDGDGDIGVLDGSFAYTLELQPGQDRDDIDFGTRPTDGVPPQVVDLIDVTPDPRQTAVSAIEVQLSKEVQLSTFDFADLTLTLNGHVVPLDSRVSVAHVSGNSYSITGLADFTGDQGEYELTVSAAGIVDLSGNAGVGSAFDLWVMDSTPPQSAVQTLPNPATSKTFAVTVAGSDVQPADGVVVSGAAWFDVYVSIDQGAFTLWQSLPVDLPTAMFTGSSGHTYGFRSVARDTAGNVESKPVVSEAWTFVPDLDAPATQVDTFTVDTDAALIRLGFSGTDLGGTGLAAFLLYVQVDADVDPTSPVELVGTFPAGNPTEGVYTGTAAYADVIRDDQVHTYRFFTVGLDGGSNVEQAPAPAEDVQVVATFGAPTSLAVTGFDVQKEATQRSYIRYLDVFFNQMTGMEDIIESLGSQTSRIKLTRYDLNGESPVEMLLTAGMLSTRDVDRALQVDFGPGGIGGDANSQQGDGYYKLSIDADNDTDHTLETDLFFYRLAGDVNHDRRVDSLDLTALNHLLADPPVEYDVNRDGVIDAQDQADADVNGDGSVTAADRLLVMRGRNHALASHLPLDD